MGASRAGEELLRLAEDVGFLAARRGAAVLTGGLGGVMEAAARGAKRAGGLTIGILPGADARQSPPNEFIDVPVFTGLGDARNWVNACSSDALIAIAGGHGTLSEIALGLKLGRPVVLLRTWRFEGDPSLPAPPRAETAEEAVEMAFKALGARR
ncbi:MAG: TIGR00725 family protein [Planctomycetes bacterium]|nr:TIGR00725 family protein [Planctomycetota bacterium]